LNHPKLYTNPIILKVLDAELEGREDENESSRLNKKIVTRNLFDFVQKQEKSIRKYQSMKESLTEPVFNGDDSINKDDAICTSLVQRYSGRILELTYSASYDYAIIAIRLATIIFGNGFGNPQTCIATFIGLLASGSPTIVVMSSKFLKEMFEKHESLFESNYTEGIKNAVLYGYETSDNLFSLQTVVGRFYLIISKSLTSRRKFVKSLGKLLTIEVSLDMTPSAAIFERDVLIFLLLNLSQVEFLSLEEPYILAGIISKVLTRQGLDLYDNFKELDSDNTPEAKIACYNCEALICLLEFNRFLFEKFNLSLTKLNSGVIDADMRHPPKHVRDTKFLFDYNVILTDVNNSTSVWEILKRYGNLIKDFDLT
jgi:cohesin loading factor subunit SCC2